MLRLQACGAVEARSSERARREARRDAEPTSKRQEPQRSKRPLRVPTQLAFGTGESGARGTLRCPAPATSVALSPRWEPLTSVREGPKSLRWRAASAALSLRWERAGDLGDLRVV